MFHNNNNGGGTSSKNTTNSPLYGGGGSAAPTTSIEPPRRMELTLNVQDGSLQTAPLLQVILAATDALYADLYNMAEGELDIITTSSTSAAAALSQQQPNEDDNNDDDPNNNTTNSSSSMMEPVIRKKEKMSNLSFAQRRYEAAMRLVCNGKSIQQVAALTGAAACTDLGSIVQVSTRALQHTRTSWVQADEAQDALYFFHAQLFPTRASPHDIYGASDLLLHGMWYDLPNDLLLQTDRYESSIHSTWSKSETDQRWQLTVRDKLLRGEVGYLRRQKLLLLQQQQQQHHSTSSLKTATKIQQPPLWRVSVKGGIVKFTVGKPKGIQSSNGNTTTTTTTTSRSTQQQYPIEAILTVIPSQTLSWTLLSVNVQVQAKTGEFNHQLETTNRQRYNLHRLAVNAMNREEARYLQQNTTLELSNLGSTAISSTMEQQQQQHDSLDNDTIPKPETTTSSSSSEVDDNIPPAQPLNALFHVTHTFLLSWILEILSAQALALRRGVWTAAADSNSVTVTPVRFDETSGDGYMSISFWKVDDSYGPPAVGELTLPDDKTLSETYNENNGASHQMKGSSSQLVLAICGDSRTGIRVSLSGGTFIMQHASSGQSQHLIQSAIRDLLDATSNPFALSASDALLAATKLCAEFKCRSVVEALQPSGDNKRSALLLPPWIKLSAKNGSIAVASRVQYHGVVPEDTTTSHHLPILFHLVCDARTGSFVPTFPRSMHLLRRLAASEIQASEAMSLRIASLPMNRRRSAGATSSGRIVRESFDSLIRAMNLIGQSTGVGGEWDNLDDKSPSLRERAILTASADVKSAMIKCIGLAALYGLVPLAVGVAFGLEALPDIAGPVIETFDGEALLLAPPVSILLGQELIETSVMKSDGVSTKTSYIEQSLFSIVCKSTIAGCPTLIPFDIEVKLDSPSAFPKRNLCNPAQFKCSQEEDTGCETTLERSPKRHKMDMNGHSSHMDHGTDVMEEVSRLAALLSATIEESYDENNA